MVKRPNLGQITTSVFSVGQLNEAYNKIDTAFDNTLSRDGSTPNTMLADLDMNSNDIINVGTLDGNQININEAYIGGKLFTGTLTWRSSWLTSTSYQELDLVKINGSVYVCLEEHTAGTFTTDLSNGKWELFVENQEGAEGPAGPEGPEGPAGPGLSDGDRGDVTISSSGAVITIDNDVVTNAKAANMAVNTIKGRITSGTGDPEDLTATQVRTIINVADGATANSADATLLNRTNHTGSQTASTISDFDTAVAANSAVVANTAKVSNATHTGDVTGATTLTIANDAVSNAKLADMATSTFKGRVTAGTGDPEDLTGAQAASILPSVSLTAPGLAVLPENGPTRLYEFDDFINNVSGDTWTVVNSGTGAGQIASNPVDVGPGWLSMNLGTTTTGRTARHTTLTMFNLGDGPAIYGCRTRVGLSTGTETFTSRWGFIDSVTGESVDGVFFRYTHSVNSGRWQAVTRSNSTETTADTGITAAINTTYTFKIEVDTSVPEAVFSIDGAVVATITTNIPSGTSRVVGAGMMGLKSAGTTATTYATGDYQYVEQHISGRT